MATTPTPAEALTKARAWCARQERCHRETRDKLRAWGVSSTEAERIIAQLIGEGFINEARFAAHFAVSKARQKGWGPRKIEHELKARDVSAGCIAQALRAIDAEEQLQQLARQVARRWAQDRTADRRIRRQRVIRFFLRKGYSSAEIGAIIDDRDSRS